MNIQEAHFAFKLAFDRINSLSTPGFNEAEVDAFLNEAQLVFIKTRYSELSNPKRLGFEQSQKRVDDLAAVSIGYPLQAAITPTQLDLSQNVYVYSIDLSSLKYEYMFLTSIRGSNSVCDIEFKQIRFNELSNVLRDPFSKKVAYYSISSDGFGGRGMIYFHCYEPIDSVKVSYIKYPSKVSTGTYVHLDGVQHPANSFELAPHTHQEIVDIAAQLAALSVQDPVYVQTRSQKVLVHE